MVPCAPLAYLDHVHPELPVLAGHPLELGGRLDPARVAAELVAVLRSGPDDTGVLVGATELPNECGATMRVLGNNSEQVRRRARQAWDGVRRVLVGCGAPDLRKG